MSVVEGLPWVAEDLVRAESALRSSVQTGDPFLPDVPSPLIGTGGQLDPPARARSARECAVPIGGPVMKGRFRLAVCSLSLSGLPWRAMSVVEGLPWVAEDLVRVESALRSSVQTGDPFLTDVASHLIGAGGKRIRPALALCAGYAAGH